MVATKYTREIVQKAVASSKSYLETLRNLNVNGGLSSASYSHLRRKIIEFEIDTSHFIKHIFSKSRGRPSNRRLEPNEILVIINGHSRTEPHKLRRALIESGVNYVCAECGLPPIWQGKPITLEVDGNWRDCRIENLQFICPNCHTQKGHTKTNTCECGALIPSKSKLCNSCFGKKRSEIKLGPFSEKGNWPSKQELADLVWNNPVSSVASIIGVSGSVVKKRCNHLGINTRPRGYWNKNKRKNLPS